LAGLFRQTSDASVFSGLQLLTETQPPPEVDNICIRTFAQFFSPLRTEIYSISGQIPPLGHLCFFEDAFSSLKNQIERARVFSPRKSAPSRFAAHLTFLSFRTFRMDPSPHWHPFRFFPLRSRPFFGGFARNWRFPLPRIGPSISSHSPPFGPLLWTGKIV